MRNTALSLALPVLLVLFATVRGPASSSAPEALVSADEEVWLDHETRRQYAKGRKGKGKAKGKRKNANKRKKPGDCGHPKITPNGGNRYIVKRSLINNFSNYSKLSRLGWSRKYSHGKVKGWQIGGFRCGKPLYAAGLRPRDVILSVNGMPTRNLAQIYAAQRRLRHKKNLTVLVHRRGGRVKLHYTIVGG